MNSKLSKLLGLGIFTSVISAGAFAEPPVQPGETLESLSKAKISTTVNGQQASLETLVNSGQIRLVNQPMSAPAQPGQQPQQSMPEMPPQTPNQPMPPQPGMPDAPVAEPAMPDSNPAPTNLESEPATATEQEMSIGEVVEQPALEQQQAAAPEATAMNEQTEIAAEAEADPAVEAPLNAAPEMPAAVEATEQ